MDLEQILSFSFKDAAIRGTIAQASSSYTQLVMQHGEQPEYPLFIKQLLGEMGIAASIIASNIKIPGTLSLQIRGTARITSAFVEITLPEDLSQEEDLSTPPSPFFIRGIARVNDDVPAPDSLDLRDWTGSESTLAITVMPLEGQSYQGIVGINQMRFMHCLEDYYSQSEQLPTKFWFQSNAHQAAGFMLQQLPQANTAAANQATPVPFDWDTAMALSNTIKADELLETAPMDLLYKLFHENPPLLHQQKRLEYKCSCSQES